MTAPLFIVFQEGVDFHGLKKDDTNVGVPQENIKDYAIKWGLAHTNKTKKATDRPSKVLVSYVDLTSKLNYLGIFQPDLVTFEQRLSGWSGAHPLSEFMERNGYTLHFFSDYYNGIGQGIFIPSEIEKVINDTVKYISTNYNKPFSEALCNKYGLEDFYENRLLLTMASSEGVIKDMLWLRVAYKIVSSFSDLSSLDLPAREDMFAQGYNSPLKMLNEKVKRGSEAEFYLTGYKEHTGFGIAIDALKPNFLAYLNQFGIAENLNNPKLIEQKFPKIDYDRTKLREERAPKI